MPKMPKHCKVKIDTLLVRFCSQILLSNIPVVCRRKLHRLIVVNVVLKVLLKTSFFLPSMIRFSAYKLHLFMRRFIEAHFCYKSVLIVLGTEMVCLMFNTTE